MPRCDNDGENVNEFCDRTGEGSSTFDLCKDCGEELENDPMAFVDDLKPYNGDPVGDAGHGFGADHPPYEGEEYQCEVCDKRLTAKDN